MATAIAPLGLTDRELELRKNFIGASESAAIMGLSKWDHASDIYHRKVSYIDTPMSDMAQMGLALEPMILQKAAQELGVELTKANRRRVHPDPDTHMQATVDSFVVGRNEIIESKLTDPWGFKCFQEDPANAADKWGESWTDEVPRYFLIQVMHQLHVLTRQTGEPWNTAYLALRIGLMEQRMYVIHYDAGIGQTIEDACRTFFADHVTPQMPPIDDGPRMEILSRLPRSTGKQVRDMDPTLIPAYEQAHQASKAGEVAKEAAKARILKFMGDAESAVDTAGRIVTYKSIASSKFDLDGFRTANSQLAQQYTNTTTSRRFAIVAAKKGQ